LAEPLTQTRNLDSLRHLGESSEQLLRSVRAFAEATGDWAALLDTIARCCGAHLGGSCFLYLVTEDGTWPPSPARFGADPKILDALGAAFAPAEAGPAGPGIVGRVAATAKLVNLSDLARCAAEIRAGPDATERVAQLGIHGLLAAPLSIRGRVAGAVVVVRHGPHSTSFDLSDEEYLSTLCDHAALAIANARALTTACSDLQEARLKEEQSKTFIALVETSSDMVAMASFDGRVLFVNKAGRALCGIAPEQDVGKLNIADFHTEDGMARAAIIKAHGKWEGEGVLRHFPTGELIPVQVSSFIARARNGDPLCFATVQRDLREPRRLAEELRQAQRMEALGRLAGGVAHDFNNLLTVILGNANLLRADPARLTWHDYLGEIEHAAESAAELTRQLLVFGRRQVLERRVVDLRPLVERLRTLLARLIGEDVRIELAMCKSAANALVDPTQIEQLVVNLALNARDAMPQGGTLRIGVEVVVLGEGRTSALDALTGPCVQITVADTGTGMAAEVRAHAFDPFFTTKSAGKGTGLGLSIAYGAVRQNEGAISFETEIGRGTTFFLHFPFASMAALPHDEKDTSLPRGTERVWLVEDQPLVRSFMETALSQLGYTVRSFASGEQLLESMASIEVADVLVTDLVLPNIDGRALAQRVEAHRPGVRVVFASGYSEDVISRHGDLPLDASFIAKPFTVETLAKAVRSSLDHHKPRENVGCRHALVIDDDPLVLTVVAGLLDALGCIASTSQDPTGIRATMADAACKGNPIDLIFLDLHLLGASGVEICRDLRHIGVDTAILCMSGDPLSPQARAEAGFDGVLDKPISHAALRSCIERYAGWSHAGRSVSPALHPYSVGREKSEHRGLGVGPGGSGGVKAVACPSDEVKGGVGARRSQ